MPVQGAPEKLQPQEPEEAPRNPFLLPISIRRWKPPQYLIDIFDDELSKQERANAGRLDLNS